MMEQEEFAPEIDQDLPEVEVPQFSERISGEEFHRQSQEYTQLELQKSMHNLVQQSRQNNKKYARLQKVFLVFLFFGTVVIGSKLSPILGGNLHELLQISASQSLFSATSLLSWMEANFGLKVDPNLRDRQGNNLLHTLCSQHPTDHDLFW
jgi:hypothetical protein